MNQIDRIEAGKMLASFIGIFVTDFQWKDFHRLAICDSNGEVSLKDCDFFEPDSNWNDLMFACYKFNALRKDGTEIGKTHKWEIHNREIWYSLNDYDINKTFPKVVDAIKWFNSQQPPLPYYMTLD